MGSTVYIYANEVYYVDCFSGEIQAHNASAIKQLKLHKHRVDTMQRSFFDSDSAWGLGWGEGVGWVMLGCAVWGGQMFGMAHAYAPPQHIHSHTKNRAGNGQQQQQHAAGLFTQTHLVLDNPCMRAYTEKPGLQHKQLRLLYTGPGFCPTLRFAFYVKPPLRRPLLLVVFCVRSLSLSLCLSVCACMSMCT